MQDCGGKKSKLLLPQNIIDQFKQQSLREYPHECCGFLIGMSDVDYAEAVEYVPAKNSMMENMRRRFVIDPQEYLDVENRAGAQNMLLVGIVHSHPDSPDKPSEFDRNHALPGFSYVIISVAKNSIHGYRSWRLTEDRKKFIEEHIDVQN